MAADEHDNPQNRVDEVVLTRDGYGAKRTTVRVEEGRAHRFRLLSDGLLGYWYLWLAGFVLAVAGFLFGRRTEPGRRILDLAKINLPIDNRTPHGFRIIRVVVHLFR